MNPRDRPTTDTVDEAIGRVLEAERAAQEAIATARSDAQVRLAAVHAQCRLIAERTEARLARARQSIASRIATREAQVEARIRELRAETTSASAQGERIDQAVAAIAAALTSKGSP
jgi:monomeric isocitrate dehydrogenase